MTVAPVQNQDFITYQGDTVTPVFTVLDATGAPVNISTVTDIAWTARQSLTDPVALLLTMAGSKITFVTDGTNGQFQVAIGAVDTALLTGFYIQSATLTFAGGSTTVVLGRMKVGQAPDWTYNASMITSSELYQVRRLIGDVVYNDPQILDQEILFALSQRSSIYGAAADCCRYIASQYSRQVDATTPGALITSNSQKAKAYLAQAVALDAKSSLRGAGAMPYAGGLSIQDKITVQSNTDRVAPQFTLYITENFIVPAGYIGGETFAGPPSAPNGSGT